MGQGTGREGVSQQGRGRPRGLNPQHYISKLSNYKRVYRRWCCSALEQLIVIPTLTVSTDDPIVPRGGYEAIKKTVSLRQR
jgi:hypothetical protein